MTREQRFTERFPVMLEKRQYEGLKELELETGATPSAQIRLAVDRWLAEHRKAPEAPRAERKRAATRKRS